MTYKVVAKMDGRQVVPLPDEAHEFVAKVQIGDVIEQNGRFYACVGSMTYPFDRTIDVTDQYIKAMGWKRPERPIEWGDVL